MVASCAAVGCMNSRNNRKNLSFFKLPKDVKIKNVWLVDVKCEGRPRDKNFYLCKLHFENDCIARDLKAQLLGLRSINKTLKDGAVPTLFPHKEEQKKRIHLVERAVIAEKRSFIASATITTPTEVAISGRMSNLIQNEWESDTTSSETAYEDQDEFLPHSESQDNSSNEEDTYNNTVSDDTMFIIYWSKLKDLLTYCMKCGQKAKLSVPSLKAPVCT